MICPSCHHRNEPHAMFCLSCGAPLEAGASQPASPPVPVEEHTLPVVAFSALNARFRLIHQGAHARDLLDAVSPDQLVIAVREGRRRGLAEFSLGPRARAAFTNWADTTLREIDGLRAAWTDADGRDRGIIADGLKAGLMSDEAQVGAALGSVFGPLGMTVGAALGGMFAGNKLDEDLRRSVTAFATSVDGWYDAAVHRYNELVPVAEREDAAVTTTRGLSAGSSPGGSAASGCLLLALASVGVIGLVGGLGYAGYQWMADTAPPVVDPAVAPAADAAPSPLPTHWRSENGTEYDVQARGEELAFVIVSDAAPHDARYRVGETEFVLVPRDATSFRVQHLVRPEPPDGTTYDDAALSDCERIVSAIDAAPLVARREGDVFDIEYAVIELTTRAFERRRTHVVGCSGIGAAEPFRRTLVLAPVGLGARPP